MQGNDNFVRIYKKNEQKESRDKKRDKTWEKDKRRVLRRIKEQEMNDDNWRYLVVSDGRGYDWAPFLSNY